MTTRPKCTIHDHHYGWDNSLPPALEVESGETIEFEVDRFRRRPVHACLHLRRRHRPGLLEDQPGDGPGVRARRGAGRRAEVEILEFRPSGFGWTAIIPGFGLLADEFSDPYLKLWQYSDTSAEFLPGIQLPVRPFPGTIGNAPAEAGHHSSCRRGLWAATWTSVT